MPSELGVHGCEPRSSGASHIRKSVLQRRRVGGVALAISVAVPIHGDQAQLISGPGRWGLGWVRAQGPELCFWKSTRPERTDDRSPKALKESGSCAQARELLSFSGATEADRSCRNSIAGGLRDVVLWRPRQNSLKSCLHSLSRTRPYRVKSSKQTKSITFCEPQSRVPCIFAYAHIQKATASKSQKENTKDLLSQTLPWEPSQPPRPGT